MENQSNKMTTHKCCDYQVNKISIKEKMLPNIYYIELWNQNVLNEKKSLLRGHYLLVFNIQTKKFVLQNMYTEDKPITSQTNTDLFFNEYIMEIINEANNDIIYYYSEFVRELRLQYFNIGKEWNEYERKVLNLIDLVRN